MYDAPVGQSLGLSADSIIRRVILRGGSFVVGDVAMFDFGFSNAATTNFIVGDSASCMVNVVAPTAAGLKVYPHCIILTAGDDGQKVQALIRGDFDPYLIKASGNIAKGDMLVATTAKNLSPDHTGGERVLAVAREALTAPSTRTRGSVSFNGLQGPTLLAP